MPYGGFAGVSGAVCRSLDECMIQSWEPYAAVADGEHVSDIWPTRRNSRGVCRLMRSRIGFVLVCAVFLACGCLAFGAEETAFAPTSLLLITDEQLEQARPAAENLRRTLRFAGQSVHELDVRDAPGLTRDRLASMAAVILAAEGAGRALYARDLLEYVQNGGVLVIGAPDWCADWMPQLGLTPPVASVAAEFVLGRGFKTVVPPYRQVHVSIATASFGAMTRTLNADASWQTRMVFLEPASAPLLLTRPYGRGQVVFWNASCLHLKELRGMFLFSLMRALPVAAMSVFNTFLFQIDDSPPPAFGLKEGPVFRDLGLDDYKFYRYLWYPRVMELLDEFGVRVNHFVCFTYGGTVQGPFEQKTDRDPFFREMLEQIRRRGDEIDFHGLNHQSLTIASGPSTPWPSQAQMIEALKAGAQLWEALRLPKTLVYCPPNNVIDAVGKGALRQGFATLRAVCRLYVGKGEDYAVESFDDSNAGDEFGADPDVPELLNVPRLSSGMFLTEATRLAMLNGIMAHGIVNHFIHPDDMYDPTRRGRDWESMLTNFRHLLRFASENLPAAEKRPTSKFLVPLRKYQACRPEWQQTRSGGLRWHVPELGRRFWYVFTQTAVKEWKTNGCRLVQTIEPGCLYLFEVTSEPASAEPGG